MTTHTKPDAAVSGIETLPSLPEEALEALMGEAPHQILEGEMGETLGRAGGRSAALAAPGR